MTSNETDNYEALYEHIKEEIESASVAIRESKGKHWYWLTSQRGIHYVPVNGDPTSVLVNRTPRYPDKKAFFLDNECPVNEDWSPVKKDYPQSSLSGLNTDFSS